MSTARRMLRAVKQSLRSHDGLGRVLGSVTATTSDAVVVTLDDGPDPVETPKVLAALQAQGATATFFVLLGRARRHPELVREILAAGHEIALHGPDHRALTDFGLLAARRRLRASRRELEALAGTSVRWYRPPYGRQTPTTWLATRTAGLVPVLWDSTTWDWKDVSGPERLAKASEGARPGAILLAHDGIAGTDDGVEDPVAPLRERAALLAQVLEVHRERRLPGRSLSDALKSGKPVKTVQFTGLGVRSPRNAARMTRWGDVDVPR